MPVPPLPDEIVSSILEELWLDLSVSRLTLKIHPPRHAAIFFRPLLLVNKTCTTSHSLT